jgi:type II restriction enzyme
MRVQAQVTVSVTMRDTSVLADFQDFCEMLLGVNAANPAVTVPAKLYRVGGANSRDGGVDLWANFGPAIQVKHVTLDETKAQPIADAISADQMVIVCDKMEKAAIEVVMKQVGLASRVRGFITKADLTRWYDRALGTRHATVMAKPLFDALLAEFDDEFSLADPSAIDAVLQERGYSKLALQGAWSIEQPVQRGKKKTATHLAKTPSKPATSKRSGKGRTSR